MGHSKEPGAHWSIFPSSCSISGLFAAGQSAELEQLVQMFPLRTAFQIARTAQAPATATTTPTKIISVIEDIS